MRAQKFIDIGPTVPKSLVASHRESITVARFAALAQDGLSNQLLKNFAVTEQSCNLDGPGGDSSSRFQEALNQRGLAFSAGGQEGSDLSFGLNVGVNSRRE